MAGCLELGGVTGSDAAGTALTLSLRRVDGPLRDRYVSALGDHSDSWDDQALDAVLNGTEYTTQHRKPFFASPDDSAYVLHEGTCYQLGSVIVNEVAETYPVLRLVEADDTTDTGVDESDEGDLPGADQRVVQIAQMAARARGNEGGVPWGLVQRGGYVYRSKTARTESELLTEDDPEHVTFRGATFAVEITSEQFHEAAYRPTADPVTEEGLLRTAGGTANASWSQKAHISSPERISWLSVDWSMSLISSAASSTRVTRKMWPPSLVTKTIPGWSCA